MRQVSLVAHAAMSIVLDKLGKVAPSIHFFIFNSSNAERGHSIGPVSVHIGAFIGLFPEKMPIENVWKVSDGTNSHSRCRYEAD
jgi:hypothetical protein